MDPCSSPLDLRRIVQHHENWAICNVFFLCHLPVHPIHVYKHRGGFGKHHDGGGDDNICGNLPRPIWSHNRHNTVCNHTHNLLSEEAIQWLQN